MARPHGARRCAGITRLGPSAQALSYEVDTGSPQECASFVKRSALAAAEGRLADCARGVVVNMAGQKRRGVLRDTRPIIPPRSNTARGHRIPPRVRDDRDPPLG